MSVINGVRVEGSTKGGRERTVSIDPGTAAVLTPIGSFHREGLEPLRLSHPQGDHTMAIRSRILDIQYGRTADPYGWRVRVV